MDIFAKVCDVIHELVGIPAENITPESTTDELDLNSLDLEELVLRIEEEFDVIIPEGDFCTVDDLIKLVKVA